MHVFASPYRILRSSVGKRTAAPPISRLVGRRAHQCGVLQLVVEHVVDAVQRAKEVITLFTLNSNTFPYLLLLNKVDFIISCLLCRLPQKLDQDQDLLQLFILHLLLDTNDLPTICLVVSTEQ